LGTEFTFSQLWVPNTRHLITDTWNKRHRQLRLTNAVFPLVCYEENVVSIKQKFLPLSAKYLEENILASGGIEQRH
jgi:hypothetical protein